MSQPVRNSVVLATAMISPLAVIGTLSSDPRLAVVWAAVVLGVEGLALAVRAVSGGRSRPVLVAGSQILIIWLATQLAAGLLTGEPTSPTALVGLVEQVRLSLQSGVPVGSDDAVLIAAGALAGVLTMLADLLFIGPGTVLGAMVPVSAIFLSAVVLSPRPVSAWAFGALAAGWALLAWSRTLDHDRRWPRRVPAAEHGWVGFTAWAGVLTAVAVAGALLAGTLVSPVERDLAWGAATQSSVELVDPVVPMDQLLRRAEDTTVLTYSTNAPGGVMLRQATLTGVDSQGWRLVDMELLSGSPEAIPGTPLTRATHTTSVQLVDLTTQYLPVPYAPRRWSTSTGVWRYDPQSLTIVDVSLNPDTTDLSYEVAHTDVEPTREALLAASAGQLAADDPSRVVPEDLPSAIATLAEQITASADTDGQAAVALQSWLRDSSRFSYDLSVSGSVSHDALVTFLTETRRGYCVHYATAMALMARTLGIPSRVAVGFTTGELGADGQWQVTAHDAHAWPELYFADLGWVRFEPTVSVGEDPAWSTDTMIEPPHPTPSADASVEPSTTPTPESAPSTPDTTAPQDSPSPSGGTTDDARRADLPWGPIAGILGVLVVAALPGTARRVVRARRLSGTGARLVEGALSEVRATARDLGVDWGEGTLQQLVDRRWALDASAAAALRRILVAAQQQRFSAHQPRTEQLVADVAAVRTGWTARADARHRFLATWLPASLWHRDR